MVEGSAGAEAVHRVVYEDGGVAVRVCGGIGRGEGGGGVGERCDAVVCRGGGGGTDERGADQAGAGVCGDRLRGAQGAYQGGLDQEGLARFAEALMEAEHLN